MQTLLTCDGGTLNVPPFVMIDREDGGNLWVLPPREVWDRSELTRDELIQWSLLVAASGRAMLEVLPQLKGGVVNYWEAGNWALNDASPPIGPKVGHIHKKVHMHLIGRSPSSTDNDWQWGESPSYPMYKDAERWMAKKQPLTFDECRNIANKTAELLIDKYTVDRSSLTLIEN